MKTTSCCIALILAFTISSNAQTKIWEKKISPSNSFLLTKAEIKDFVVGSDGKIYSTGFYRGNRALFGSLLVHSDSNLTQPRRLQTSSETETSFLACQSPTGDFLWVKNLVSDESVNSVFMPDWLGTNLGTKVTLGPDGSIYFTGFIFGDSIRFGNSVLPTNSGLGFAKLYIVKTNGNGDLTWGKTFNSGPFGVFPRFLKFIGSDIALVVSHGGQLEIGTTPTPTTFGLLQIIFDQQGNILSNVPYGFSSPLLNGFDPENNFTRRLPDGKWVISHFAPFSGYLGSFLSILNPDFSLNQTLKIEMKSGNGGIKPIFPLDFLAMPQNKFGLFVGISNDLSGDENIMVGNDTLSVGSFTSGSNPSKSLLIKLSDYNCMKHVEGIDQYLAGSNSVSGNGNIFSIGIRDMNFGYDSSVFQQYNRNGELISKVNLEQNGYVNYTNFEVNGAISSQFTSQLVNQDLFISHGQHIFKLQIQDPVANEESFSGCLSNRALLLNTEGASPEFPEEWVSKVENGIIFHIKFTGNQAYKLIDSHGKVLKYGIISEDENEIVTRNLPSGIFLFQLETEKGVKSFKILN